MIRRYVKHKLACWKLARLVEANKQSFQLKDYVRRRDAALRGRAMPSARALALRVEPVSRLDGSAASIAIAEVRP